MAYSVFLRRILGVSAALAVAVTVWAAPGTASAQSSTGGSSAEDLLYRLQVLDAEIADIRARVGGSAGGTAGRPVTGGSGAALESELRRLTARLEQIERAQRELRADLGRRLGDIEYRLNELEGVPNDGTSAPLAGDISGTTNNSGGSGNAAAPAAAVSERNSLNLAIQDVQNGRYDQAQTRLDQFLREYPDSPLVGEAWYWKGEAMFVRGIHGEAAKSFLNGYNSDRRGNHAAQNLYKLGVTLGRLGQVNEACLTLFEVKSQFPNTGDIANDADRAADELSCS